MHIYLVGGAVRDKLLGIPVKEKDYVVVGATAEEMLQAGYRQVGKDFPVFLHPQTNEEYALARLERKVSLGYTGFTFDTSPKVTLEEDLKRRDLTINAMAETLEGELIDPYQGKKDLEQKKLRHVSNAFVEDPVRILRVARFAARFADFCVAEETLVLMQKMVASGEVDALVAERVWKELERGLKEKAPERFFEVLEASGALVKLFPEITQKGRLALHEHEGEINDTQIRFAILIHDLLEKDLLALCERYRLPTDYKELGLLVTRYYTQVITYPSLNAEKVLALLLSLDAFRREERFVKILTVWDLLSGKPIKEFFTNCLAAAKKMNVSLLIAKGLKGNELAHAIQECRIKEIKKYLAKNS